MSCNVLICGHTDLQFPPSCPTSTSNSLNSTKLTTMALIIATTGHNGLMAVVYSLMAEDCGLQPHGPGLRTTDSWPGLRATASWAQAGGHHLMAQAAVCSLIAYADVYSPWPPAALYSHTPHGSG